MALQINFTGEGCEVAKTCLECPLPVCRFEVGLQAQLTKLRGRKFLQLYQSGQSADKISKQSSPKLAPRTIRYILAQAREDSQNGIWQTYQGKEDMIPFIEKIVAEYL